MPRTGGRLTLALLVGELLSEQSSGRFLAVPALSLEVTVATHSALIFAGEAEGAYAFRSESDGGDRITEKDAIAAAATDGTPAESASFAAGTFVSSFEAGVHLAKSQAFGEALAGPALRLKVANFGDYEAFSATPAVRLRLVAGWQAVPKIAIRGGVGGWIGLDGLDIDGNVGAAWCF